jgi:hypothetical protein
LLEYLTRYSVIGDPPVLAGATHVTASWASPLTATTAVGALGTAASVAGVAGADLTDVVLMPIVFCGANATMLEMSMAERVAGQPLDA